MKRSPFMAFSTLASVIITLGCWGPSKRDAGNIAISKIEEFKRVKGRLPNSLSESGVRDDESCPCYCKTGNDSYIVWYGTSLGESDTYDSETKRWSEVNRACGTASTQTPAVPPGQVSPQANEENRIRDCSCDERLTESQMGRQAEHIDMEQDVIGNHVNVSGTAVLEVVVENDGRVQCVQALSGHPLAVAHLIAASHNWKFKPYLKAGRAQRFCGLLRLRFSFVENKPFAGVVGDSR